MLLSAGRAHQFFRGPMAPIRSQLPIEPPQGMICAMRMVTALLNLLRGYRKSLLPLEEAIFAELRALLPEHLQQPFDERLKRIIRIQSIIGGTEILYYERHKGKVLFSQEGRIVSRNGSIKLATVKSRSNSTRN
jgi:hypothetical protein